MGFTGGEARVDTIGEKNDYPDVIGHEAVAPCGDSVFRRH